MIIKSINLENIRSYTNKKIKFDLGSTLLSGDIGSGKSTILLAMDFALFGLSKGIITGEALLRHGERHGSVELNFIIDDKNIKVKRTLKKSGDSVVQDSGYLMINDELFNLSPVELKQRILQLLNYPQEVLTKKSLIYRYTVYTPQEEMKSILLGRKEDRLDTLRRIFNIDKYKRIKKNSEILSSELRGRIKEYEFMVSDLEDIKKKKTEKIESQKELEVKVNELNKKLLILQEKIKVKKEEVFEIEERIKMLNEFKKEFELNELNLKNNSNRIKNNKTTIERLNKEINELDKENLKQIDIDSVYRNLLSYRGKLSKVEEELLSARKSLNESKYAFMDSDKLVKEVKGLNVCPVCLQKVTDDHKHKILGKEEVKVKDLAENIKIYTKKENELVRDLQIINEEIEKLNESKANHEVRKLKIKNLNEKKENYSKFFKENEELEILIKEIENKKSEIDKKIKEFGDIKMDEIRKYLDDLLEDEKKSLLNKNSAEYELKNINSEIIKLDDDIINKEKTRDKMFNVKKLKGFIDDDFSRLVETIERKVMLRVHNDFNELFIKWFNILIDDEDLNVKLDEEFSVLIEQNGYNMDYLFLSGGEKTAGALAYRLALNQVINNLIVNIKTKDLLILDEPTDGFSEDQLDRVRLVLDELNIKQVILVSHESKIESFVNNVIRLNKKEGVSEII
jgi:exonuclease SbcC